ncbi:MULTISPECIES: coenzyme F420 hydrogenase subunit beta [Methanothermobacter]|jgi:coenzyme F420 hydrogenase subunit beta|uniref:Coenzyme F420 hydrogenase subunit beta n=1 Tax=Methanothermobacter marburgensis (strain ATCC BAA-927 / DSM 2133 / JCM 14651 / NBRC 100331 / OCM 82 / Marburg) TaxID=79929 RepID=D9PYF6_METTM|nr:MULTISPECIES: coenzyme F420 hydrogenase subunit beta [Methanothermobacter]3ZFS_C Chain C, F420-REDUCING HYDROGENASE, SUBUNIT BETA [Methanothermobacter marburgensis]4CI0_C Chain C, F420-REDUCING HYDROGENASE, SUBUNIT BETA [Methanothermobacter marburgensis]4OMF_B Chain B, F420-reducing hydrogenase, subunit beta [Methanothermobacter marburgensis str. Marburg]ADL59254.1 F420-reducing hydrogenase, subunit beta [Methanothermobacter marburgensis str. Marburg]MCG2828052.1 coenzyme F420 hydrogenase s
MVLGTYKEIVSARSTDREIQKLAQDGGIVTGLLAYALDEGIIEGAVVAGPGEEFWKPQPMVAMSSDELKAAAGTKYTFSPNVMMLKKAVRQYGIEKLGTVAIPCQTMGIRKMQTYPFGVRFLADKIKLLVGIYCMENFPYTSLQTFICEKLGVSMELVEKMDIGKGKFWVYTQDDVLTLPLKETHGYEQAGCKICKDYVAELADVSTGSVGSPDGWSTVITRTDAGDSIFKQAVEAGLFETKPIEEVKPGLGLLEKLAAQKKEKAEKNIAARKEMGLPTPF